jgi:preprotein translocase subunit SecD
LDDAEVDSLNIGEDLQGRAVTDIQISGSGVGSTQQEAVFNSLENMKRLQTILITGSLPVKLDIVKTDAISAIFGKELIKNALFIGMLAILSVAVVVFIRYRKLSVAVPLLLTSVIEVILILGVASLIGWNLDLAAIAGIIIAVGTGVDHLIVITDESLRGERGGEIFDWKRRIKSAFSIIMAAFFTTIVAMLPLWFAGAGLLKGFALTTIIGVSMGVFIARPAFAAVIEILLKK